LTGALGEQLRRDVDHGVGLGLVDAVGDVTHLVRRDIARVEPLRVEQPIDEQAKALLGGDPAGRRVRLFDQAHHRQFRERRAHTRG